MKASEFVPDAVNVSEVDGLIKIIYPGFGVIAEGRNAEALPAAVGDFLTAADRAEALRRRAAVLSVLAILLERAPDLFPQD